MSTNNCMIKFFKKVDQTYHNAVKSIRILIEQGEHIQTSYTEIDLLLQILAHLRLNLKQEKQFTFEVLEELVKGGHLKFDDGGLFYNELVRHFGSDIKKRTSSHHSCVQQYSISGPVVKEVLFGVSVDTDGNKTTWIQFENHSMDSILELILHLFDYLMHKVTGKNIGPYGRSDFTEKNPLVVGLDQPMIICDM